MRLDFLDALRGYAILGVMLVHTALIAFPVVPQWFLALCNEGVYGVQLFFIVSACTIFYALSYSHKDESSWRNFFLRRLFRILPLFYVAIVVYAVMDLLINHAFWFFNIFFHFTLLFSILPLFINKLVPGGWTIATELMFYAVVPILFTRIRNLKQAVALTGIALVLCPALSWFLNMLPIVTTNPDNTDFVYFWLPAQFPVFCFGILLFFVLKNTALEKESVLAAYSSRQKDLLAGGLILAGTLAVIGLLLDGQLGTNIVRCYLYGSAFTLIAAGLAINPVQLFVNRFTTYLGKISYSCYLVHFVFVGIFQVWFSSIAHTAGSPVTAIGGFLVLYGIVIGLTIFVSSYTYTWIEQPGIAWGKSYISRIARKKTKRR